VSEAVLELIRRIERLEKELNRSAVIEPSAGAGGGAPADATYLTLSTNATLSAERVATAGANIALSDGGAGGALGIAVSPQGPGSGLNADTVDGVQLAGLVQTSRTISPGVGLTGGGDLSANRTLAVNIPGLTEELTPDTADSIIVYDDSAGAHRRQTRQNFLGGLGSTGWPFANIITVDSTNVEADYSTIAAAISGASAGDAIILNAETFSENITLSKALTLIVPAGATITASSGNTVSVTASGVVIAGEGTIAQTSGGRALSVTGSCTVRGGVRLDGDTYDAYNDGGTINLVGAELVNGLLFGTFATCWYSYNGRVFGEGPSYVFPTNHFRSGSIPSGYSWAGSPFATPGTISYNFRGDWLRTFHAGTASGFLQKSVSSYIGSTLRCRIDVDNAVNGGLRVDDGASPTHLAELRLIHISGSTYLFRLSEDAGVSDATVYLTGSALTVQLLIVDVGGGSWRPFCYIVNETGQNTIIHQGTSVSWTIARAGIAVDNTGALIMDWFSIP